MALTVTFNGTNVTTADSVTDWDNITITAPELWEVEVLHQGGGSIGFQASSKDGLGCYEMPTGSFNFSTTHAGQHVFMWVNVTMPGTVEALATGGLYLVVGSSQTAYKKFLVAAKDYKEVMEKGFARFVFDPTKTATETVGTPDMTAITLFGVWIDTDETARIDQLFIDRIDVGWGLTVSGTSTDFWNDLALGDIGLNAGIRDNMFGGCQKYNDVFFLYGQLNIEQGASANTVISDSAKTVKFVSQQYYNGSAWVDLIADDFFKIEFNDDATYATQVTDGVAVGSDAGRSGSSISGSILHDTEFDVSLLTNASSFVKLYATALLNMRSGITFHSDVDSLFYSGSITASGQFDPKIAKMRNLIIAETTDIDSALLWNENIDIQDCSFIANTVGAAIEMPSAAGTPYSYTTLFFSGNTYDVLNSSGSAITVNKLSGADPSTYEGSTVTFSATYAHTITGLEQNTEVTYVTAGTTTELYHVENATVSDGDGKYKITYSHSGGASVDVLIHHVSYKPDISNIYGITLPNSDATVKVTMFADENYYNPA